MAGTKYIKKKNKTTKLQLSLHLLKRFTFNFSNSQFCSMFLANFRVW